MCSVVGKAEECCTKDYSFLKVITGNSFLSAFKVLQKQSIIYTIISFTKIISGVGAYLLACKLATLAQKGASQALARLAFFRVPSHDIA